MRFMKKIVVLNAYGQKNIGDEAIQYSAFSIISSVLESKKSSAKVTVLCEDPVTFPNYRFSSLKIDPIIMPYGYSLRSLTQYFKSLQKIIITFRIFLFSILYIILGFISPIFLPQTGFYSYLRKIYEADNVMGIGGGYLISKSPLKDLFGLSLTLLPLFVAKIYKKDIVHLPISFGPFASSFHEYVCFLALKNTTVFTREKISYDLLNKYDRQAATTIQMLPDLALLLKNPEHTVKKDSYWVLTAREWLEEDKQKIYEATLAKLVDFIWDTYQLKSVFLVMVHNLDEDDDMKVFNRIKQQIANKQSLISYLPKNHRRAQLALSNASFSVCTRMHSAILSLTVNCPFLTIGYGHKGKGFVESIGLNEWYLDISEVNEQTLFEKFNSFFNRENVVNLKSKIKTIKNSLDSEEASLKNYLSTYLK